MTTTTAREPRGLPIGGRFAPTHRAEPDLKLDPSLAALDRELDLEMGRGLKPVDLPAPIRDVPITVGAFTRNQTPVADAMKARGLDAGEVRAAMTSTGAATDISVSALREKVRAAGPRGRRGAL